MPSRRHRTALAGLTSRMSSSSTSRTGACVDGIGFVLLCKHQHTPNRLYDSGLGHAGHGHHRLTVSGVVRLLCVMQLQVYAVPHSHKCDWRGAYRWADDRAKRIGVATTASEVGATSKSQSETIVAWRHCSSFPAASPSPSEGISRSVTGTRRRSGPPYPLERRARLRTRASAICSSRPKTTPARLPTTSDGAGSGNGPTTGTDAAIPSGSTGERATAGRTAPLTARSLI